MGYVENLMIPGEEIVVRSRQHWMMLVVRARNAILLWLIGLAIVAAILWFRELQGEAARNILSVASTILLLLGAIVFLYRLAQHLSQNFVVTNRRLLKVTGILTKRSADSALEKINDAILHQTVLGRMLNYGDLEILTASDQANDRYVKLRDPIVFRETILTQKHELEMSYAHGAQPPSPPMRAPTEQSVVPAAPVPAPEPQAPLVTEPAAPALDTPVEAAPVAETAASDTDESLEVTETLSRLADLRDEGAITAEEYEVKKDELLGRL